MYKKTNGHDHEEYDDEVTGTSTDAALIDSYFLPGGILDPEESSSGHNHHRPHDTDATNVGYDNEGSGSNISPSHEINGRRNVQDVEEEYFPRHDQSFPIHNSRHQDSFLNNDLLRSRLEQLNVGSRSFDYGSNVIQSRPNSLPIGSGTHRSSRYSYLEGEGVSALDPLADSVVVGGGGRSTVSTSIASANRTSLGLPLSFPVQYTERGGIQGVTPVAPTVTSTNTATNHAFSTADTGTASASTSSTAPFGNIAPDWFSSYRPTSSMSNVAQEVSAVQGQEDYSNFLSRALINTSSSSSFANDANGHKSLFQRHLEPFQKVQTSSLGSCVDQDGSLNSSNLSIQRNPWKLRDDNHEEVSKLHSFAQSSFHRVSPSNHHAVQQENRNMTTSFSETQASASKGSLPIAIDKNNNNSSFYLPTDNQRVNPPPGFISSSSPSPPVTSSIQGTSTRDTFHRNDNGDVRIAGAVQNGTLQRRTSNSAQELRYMHFPPNHREPDTFGECSGIRHPASVARSPYRTRNEDEHRHHRNQQPQVVHSPGKNRQQESKTPSRHHNDGDYDLSSLNTKLSRDVPSTIYVEEDTLSTSEDTLTVCADSVTEVSLPNKSHGKVVEYDRNGMDAVQETDAAEKRSKSKRSKKKRNKRKHQVQESVASQDTSSHPDEGQLDTYRDTADEANPKSESEEESKETEKVIKILKETKTTARQQEQPLVTKTHANSRSSATATEPSSSAETILHSPTKKGTQHKTKTDKHHRRNNERRIQTPSKPRGDPWLEVFSKWCWEFVPVARNAIYSIIPIMYSAIRSIIDTCKSWFPNKERFWFLFPMCCVSIDLFFLSCAILFKTCGLVVYLLLMTHKLALMELVESDYTAICYSVIFFYPNIVKTIKFTTNQQYYWYIFARWLAIDRFFCRPITVKDTYLHNVKKLGRNESAMNVMKHSLKEGNRILPSFKAAVDHIIRVAKTQKLEESERIKMANHILLILRRATPLIMILESQIHRSGFLVLLTNTERILFGYGLAVLRTGYLFSPLIWISWTIQLTIIMFTNSSSAWCYFILMLGLVSIRLSHYSAAVEDLDGVDAMNSYSTSKRRRMAAYSHYNHS
mmetsp:Transcript_6293/g.11889  ORF Transcript_6293/g.11889 Transcript_6293/m.11889 type:complete len:1097 (-) Transcript_6293:184-3474(-)